MKLHKTGVISAGLALFSMFFGAGDLIWPLILGGETGEKNVFAVIGLLITGVSLPLLGLIAMNLFQGDHYKFFRQIGRMPGIILLFFIQAILGPFGSTPRLFTLAHATLKPYLPEFLNLPIFCIFAIALVFMCAIYRHRIIDIVGLFLSPILLASLGLIIFLGLSHHPIAQPTILSEKEALFRGLNVGYNTLDLIASFIFAPLVLCYFKIDEKNLNDLESQRHVFKKMIKSSLIAGFLLAIVFIGLTYIGSYYTSILPLHNPEERLGAISIYLLGSKGAFFSCLAVSLSCLTTAIPISVISAEYIQGQFMKNKGGQAIPMLIGLLLSAIVANLGFMGIANMLNPILQILCPGLIILSLFSILHKIYEMPIRRAPIFAAFALSLISYFLKLNFH
ncbi:MAG: branched-chain amino acid transport system II carrier protein [Chlamydiales bacterium]